MQTARKLAAFFLSQAHTQLRHQCAKRDSWVHFAAQHVEHAAHSERFPLPKRVRNFLLGASQMMAAMIKERRASGQPSKGGDSPKERQSRRRSPQSAAPSSRPRRSKRPARTTQGGGEGKTNRGDLSRSPGEEK